MGKYQYKKLKPMDYAYLILGLIGLYLLFSGLKFLWFFNFNDVKEFTQQEERLGNGPSFKYIAAGDSTAVGEGSSKASETYTYHIAEHFAGTKKVSYKNIAERGAKTSDVISKQLPQILEYNPDVVTISVGANDMTRLKSNHEIFENYKVIVNTLVEKTNATIYITDIPNFNGANLLPWPYIRLLENRISKLNPQIKQLESERVKIVNIHDYGWDNYPDRGITYASDHFHPNDEGYNNWANAFLSRIRE